MPKVKLPRSKSGTIDFVKSALNRLREIAEKKKQIEDRITPYATELKFLQEDNERTREEIKGAMMKAKLTETFTEHGSVTFTPGRESVVIDDESLIPDSLLRKEPNLIDIKYLLIRGDVVPGASLKTGDPVMTVRLPKEKK